MTSRLRICKLEGYQEFRPAAIKNGRNLCAHRWLKQLMPNGSSQDFKVYRDSLEKTHQASYDIKASNLVSTNLIPIVHLFVVFYPGC
ncbi:hypothetical protein CY34DRAFT_804242 [Suillus luteus UH-Slu-Lm8-n1]|uniref:Uncharacterized protein n=1 Tax=Suillus luteus UH-Slu-Lm8-n1 TaxID=930992 RepID=A0A0D0B9R5_9AGAM|nr:hypothetical protein CY34DRAFT_804242 [Suillus luteus UH-Slu-Lm8-n1]